MTRSRVEVNPRLNRLLRRAEPAVTEELKDEIGQLGMAVLDGARRRVPVDTGDLRDSISIRRGSNGLSVEVGFSNTKFRRAWKRGGWYARFIEYGTKGYQPGDTRKTSGSRTTKKIKQAVAARPARPFMAPAFEEARAEGLPRIRQAVRRVLEKLSAGS